MAWFFGVTAAMAAVMTAVARRLSRRWNVLDHPHSNGGHREPMPLLGGAAIFAALSIVVWGHLLAGELIRRSPALMGLIPDELERHLPGFGGTWGRLGVIFGGGALMFLVGLWDDVKGVSIRKRIYPELLIAMAVAAWGIRAELGFLPAPLAFAVSVLWLVGIANSFNLIDGVDGLAAGLAAIAAGFLGVILLLTRHPATATLLFCVAGASLGFLAFNWHPAKIFMGSSGSLFLGYMLGASTLVATFGAGSAGVTNWLFPLLIPLLVFAVPLYDTVSVILIRLKLKRSIFEGDRSHFHHRLMRIGFTPRQTVAFLYILSSAFSAAALLISRTDMVPNAIVLFQAMILVSLIVLMERVVTNVVVWKRSAFREAPSTACPSVLETTLQSHEGLNRL